MNGYLPLLTLEERLLHVQEAKKKLGSGIAWICDTMENEVKHGFGGRPNSEFVIDPHGKIVAARQWSDPEALRGDLAKLLGPVEIPTSIRNLDMKTAVPPKEAPRDYPWLPDDTDLNEIRGQLGLSELLQPALGERRPESTWAPPAAGRPHP